MILFTSETGEGRAVACDVCTEVLEPGERWTEPGPWTEAEALSAAESRGWMVTLDWQVCAGWHSPDALAVFDAKVARRAVA